MNPYPHIKAKASPKRKTSKKWVGLQLTRNQYQIMAKVVCMHYWEDSRSERFYSDHPRQTKFPQLTPCPVDSHWDTTSWCSVFRLSDVLEGLIYQPLRNNTAIHKLCVRQLLKETVIEIKVGNLTIPRPYVTLTEKGTDWADARDELPGLVHCHETDNYIVGGNGGPKCLDLTTVRKHAMLWKKREAYAEEKKRLKGLLKNSWSSYWDYPDNAPGSLRATMRHKFPYNPKP